MSSCKQISVWPKTLDKYKSPDFLGDKDQISGEIEYLLRKFSNINTQ